MKNKSLRKLFKILNKQKIKLNRVIDSLQVFQNKRKVINKFENNINKVIISFSKNNL